jgi:hypothetical protein
MPVIPVGIVWMYSGSFTVAALAASCVTVLGVTAFIYKVTRSPLILAVIPASYLLAYAVSGSFATALFSLVLFPAAAVMSLSVSGKLPRISLICRTSIALFITALSLIAVYIAVTKSGFSLNALKALADSLYCNLREHFTAEYASVALKYAEQGLSAAELSLTESDASSYALALFCAIPAIFVIAINIISFCSSQLTVSLFASGGLNEYLTPVSLSFSMSWVSAAVFLLSYISMLFSYYGGYDIVALITENIYLMLLPGLAFTGVLALLGRGPGHKKHVFILIAVAILFLSSPNSALAVVAFIGCYTVAKAALIVKISKTRK